MRFIRKIIGTLMLALLLAGSATIFLAAQEQPPAPAQHDENRQGRPPGPGRQLAHESREAAGEEEDEMESC